MTSRFLSNLGDKNVFHQDLKDWGKDQFRERRPRIPTEHVNIKQSIKHARGDGKDTDIRD